VIYSEAQTSNFANLQIPFGQMLWGFVFVLSAVISIYSQTQVVSRTNEDTITVENSQSEVYSFGKNVIVKGNSQGVFAFGGDVIVEGTVDGDVATIGGSIIQKENAFVGGDVIIFGGTYRPESKNPLRNADKETVMIAVFEDELRNLTQNPSQLFSPTFSPAFLAQRVLSILFWFVLSLALTTISPGAISRAIARFRLSTLKVIAIGFFSFVGATVSVMICLNFLPNYINAIVVFMVFLLLILAYVFGRVALQLIVGKQLQKQFLPESKQSETLAILIGVIVWTIFLSVPYLWIFALLALISASIGLVLTARSNGGWQKA
jgi:hypothetical protein